MTETADLDRVFKALADPTRRKLLDSLRQRNGQSLRALGAEVDMARQSLTQHIDLLVAADLVVVVREGRERRHYLNPAPIHEIQSRWVRDFDQPHLSMLHGIKKEAEKDSMTTNETFPDHVYATYIHATAQQVWDALTDPLATSRYWHGMANTSDWAPGSTWTHTKPDGTHDIWGRVLESEPPHRLAFTFQPTAQPLDDPGSTVTYLIEEAEGVTRLTITHTGLPDPDTLAGITRGWATVAASLKSYLETGSPLPEATWQLMKSTLIAPTRQGAGA